MLQIIRSQKTPIFSYSMVFFGYETLCTVTLCDYPRWNLCFVCEYRSNGHELSVFFITGDHPTTKYV